MNVLITGGTGFIGSALCSRLLNDNHSIVLLSRYSQDIQPPLKAVSNLQELKEEAFDIIINLAGEPIANKRWSSQQKQNILDSRINTTRDIITYLKQTKHKPKLLINGSAVGYYGLDKSNDIIDESAYPDNSFSSELCQRWESTALQAQELGIRTCLLRTGIVLGKNGGALSNMLFPFKMGLGGRIGDGEQWMPWIHLDDLLGIILYCIAHDDIKGAINATAPNSVTNHTFTKALGTALKRPTFFPLPKMIVKLLFGQMGEELLLTGKRISPKKVLEAGYDFQFKTLEDALNDILG